MLISSCRSIDKMIESGNYDQAFRFGVDKLRGKKNKKTKYVRGIEKAYKKLNDRDLKDIRHHQVANSKYGLDRVVDIYQNMDIRQEYIIPLLPLVSEDGFVAEIEIRDYTNLILDAKNNAAEYHYAKALKLLETSRETFDKATARDAYNTILFVEDYFDNYKDSYQMKREAYELGTTNILVEPYVNGSNIVFDHTLDIISQINTNNMNTKWKKFHLHENSNWSIDLIATIEVDQIMPGKETERYNSFEQSKEIVDGTKPKKTKDGIAKDSLGRKIYVNKYKTVTALIEELIREKSAYMNGRVVIVDALTNTHINTIPINVTHLFEDYSCNFSGDKRALSSKFNKRLKPSCNPFPTDYEMTTDLANIYRDIAEQNLREI